MGEGRVMHPVPPMRQLPASTRSAGPVYRLAPMETLGQKTGENLIGRGEICRTVVIDKYSCCHTSSPIDVSRRTGTLSSFAPNARNVISVPAVVYH
jgi:hypothetical protein